MSSVNTSSITTPKGNPEFVRLDSKHLCQVCRNVVREAMQTSCGHRICQNCIEPMFKDSPGPVMCPANEEDCEEQYKDRITLDPSGRREVRDLLVFCDYSKYGCKQELKWKNLERHVIDCQYQPEKCQNPGCEEVISKVNRPVHQKEQCPYRPVPCQYCHIYVTLKLMEQHVQEECTNVQLPCPYNCSSLTYPREELNSHKESCPNKPSQCKFQQVGCTFEGKVEDVAHHMVNGINEHLELVTVYVANAEVQSLEFRRELQGVKSERDQSQAQVQKLLKEMDKQHKSNKDMMLKMVSMTERIIRLEKQSETLSKKEQVEQHDRDIRAMQASLTQVRAQLVRVERTVDNRGGSGAVAEHPDILDLKTKVDRHDAQLGQADVQLAELDMRFQMLETASYDGTLLWKVRDYSRRKLEAVQGKTVSLYSQPFYTHKYGYKMCARVYLNGDGIGKGSHMSLFFVIMRGEYDNLLKWPFQQKVTMSLLDQDSNGQANLSDTFRPDQTSSSFKKPTTDMNIASGCPLFVSHAILETTKYVKDDAVLLKFVVESEGIPHP
ncbi:TNF receptor-associated factor 3 [Mactra antiquata]